MRTVLLFITAFLCINGLQSQIKGNGIVVTKEISVSEIKELEISLYAKIEVDLALPNSLSITAEENLFDYIDSEVLEGRLELTQKKWIKPSKDIIIKIGAPALEWVQQGTHEEVLIRNIDKETFVASALVGEIVLEGKVVRLNANGEVGDIDARNLDVEEVLVNLWSWGKIKLSDPKVIKGSAKNAGQVIYDSKETIVQLETKDDARTINLSSGETVTNPDARFINFRLKNNSLKRINAYVRGPKPDGSHFSYGFPMLPGQVRKKDWSVGSRVYKVSPLGIRKLLLEITEDNEDQVVRLF